MYINKHPENTVTVENVYKLGMATSTRLTTGTLLSMLKNVYG
jgi:hypothetical protein